MVVSMSITFKKVERNIVRTIIWKANSRVIPPKPKSSKELSVFDFVVWAILLPSVLKFVINVK